MPKKEEPLFKEPLPVIPDAIRNELGSFPFPKPPSAKLAGEKQQAKQCPWKKKRA